MLRQYSLKILLVTTYSLKRDVFGSKKNHYFTSVLEHALFFLRCIVNEHVFMNLVSLGKKFSPHYFLDLAKHCVFWELEPHELIGIIGVAHLS